MMVEKKETAPLNNMVYELFVATTNNNEHGPEAVIQAIDVVPNDDGTQEWHIKFLGETKIGEEMRKPHQTPEWYLRQLLEMVESGEREIEAVVWEVPDIETTKPEHQWRCFETDGLVRWTFSVVPKGGRRLFDRREDQTK